jgi:hypothetical protein
MSDFKSLFNRYASDERLDCKKYLSHHIMTNRVERPSEYLMDEFARRALELAYLLNRLLKSLILYSVKGAGSVEFPNVLLERPRF